MKNNKDFKNSKKGKKRKRREKRKNKRANVTPIDYLQIYNALEGACRYYSKMRLSLPTTLDTEPIGEIYLWNPPKFATELGLNFPHTSPVEVSVPYFQIRHDQAKSMKNKTNALTYEIFLACKDYYAVNRIHLLIQSDIDFEIEFAHDPKIIDELNQIRSFSTCQSTDIEFLSEKVYGFWIFKYTHEDNMIKLPAFHGKYLILKELLQIGKDVTLCYRKERSSKNQTYDTEKYISYKNFILDKDRTNYQNVIRNKALENINYLITDKKLLTECIINQNSFRDYKNQNA